MKISKSLLQAIVVGVTLGTAVSSCDIVETITKEDIKNEQTNVNEEGQVPGNRENNNEGGNTCDNCPGCGMG